MERKLAACSVLFGFGICVAVIGGYGLVTTQCAPLTVAEKEQLRGGEDCYEDGYVDCSEYTVLESCEEGGCDDDDYCVLGSGDYSAAEGGTAIADDESDGGFTLVTYFEDFYCTDVYSCGDSEGECTREGETMTCGQGEFDFEADEFVEAMAWGDCCSSVGG
jgi:hypothetical protein